MSKHNTSFMADHVGNLADVEVYGCLPMSIAELMDEFENFPILEDEDRVETSPSI